ncbi:hypothetical protein [Spirulina major]|uniref:hypothetical protein n=1 Tax=Spirulina major TaxID=270636 RepID=UPI0009354BE0|nr:hypothetical protein [Spirulina major]
MTRNDLLVAARRGEPDAIASLLNRQLRTKDMTVRVTAQGKQITLLVEAVTPPPQAPLVKYLRHAFTQLAAPAIHRLRICGTQQGAATVAWTTELELTPPPPPSVEEIPSPPSEPLPPPPKPSDYPPPPRPDSPSPSLDPLPPPKPPTSAPTASDTPAPSGAKTPRLLVEWFLVSGGAGLVAVVVHSGLGAILEGLPGAIAPWLVDAVTGLVLGIAQSYALTRYLEKSHWWAVTYLVLPILAMVPTLIAILGIWGLQAWILGTQVRRSYWWILGNMAMVVVFAGVAIAGIILLRALVFFLSFATVFLYWLAGVILAALMLLIQGAILERLFYGVPERSRPAPDQYLQHLYDHLQEDLQRLIAR